MPNYRRARVSGGTYFFTVVTYGRKPLLVCEDARRALREAIREVRYSRPFKIDAFCLLPDHLHTIWTLPKGDSNYSQRWSALKSHFSRNFLCMLDRNAKPTGSRLSRGERMIWHRRFWEHLIVGEDDLQRHLDYVHYNPVKHGHAKAVIEWPWSSFHRYVREGVYPKDWGGASQAGLNLVTVGERVGAASRTLRVRRVVRRGRALTLPCRRESGYGRSGWPAP